MCYPAEFGRSSSNGSSVTKENPPEKFDLLRTAFQGHYSLRSSEPIRIDRLRMTFYKKKSTATMGLSRTVSEINGNFSRKSQIFPPRVYLPHPLRGFPLEPGGRKKIE